MTHQNMTILNQPESKVVSLLMVLAGALLIMGMLFHPEITTDTHQEQLNEIVQKSAVNSFVHGFVIILIWMLFAGSMLFYRLIHTPHILKFLAGITYFLCTLTMTGAALTSGFITQDIVLQNPDISSELFQVILSAGGRVNQTLAYMGNWCLMISGIFVALMLLQENRFPKTLSYLMFISILTIFFLFVTEILRLNVFGTTVLVIFWVGFIAVKAAWLWRFESE